MSQKIHTHTLLLVIYKNLQKELGILRYITKNGRIKKESFLQNSAPRRFWGRKNFPHLKIYWWDHQPNSSFSGWRFQNQKFEKQERQGCCFVDLGHCWSGKICLHWLCLLQGSKLLHFGVFSLRQKLLRKFGKMALKLPWKVECRPEFLPLHGDWKQERSCYWEAGFRGRSLKLGKIERIFLLWDVSHRWYRCRKGFQGGGWAWVGPEWGRRWRDANKSRRGFRGHQNGLVRRSETHWRVEAKEEKVQMLNTPNSFIHFLSPPEMRKIH